MSKQWINTSVEYQWSDELDKLVQVSKEGYWYEGEMTLCTNIMATGTAHQLQSNDNGYIYVLNSSGQSYSAASMFALNAIYFSGQVHGAGSLNLTAVTSSHVLGGSLKITTGDSSVSPSTSANDLLVETTAITGITIGSGSSSSGHLYFGDSEDAGVGQVSYDHSSNFMTFATGGSERVRIDSSGNVGIGDSSPSYALEVTGTFYSSGSSIEYKQEVEPYIPPEGALMSLKPIQYKYKAKWKSFGKRYAGNSHKQLGFVAEEVEKILPELAVTKSEDGEEVVRNVDYEKLTVLLVSEVQKLRTELDEIKNN